MASKPLPDADLLRQLFRYNPNSGSFTWQERPREMFNCDARWKGWNKRCAGKEAGVMDPIGYRKVTLFGRQWLAHRLIWKIVTGTEPDCIDHINGDRGDNRFANLRDASFRENARNISIQSRSKSGCNGVVWVNGKWLAQIRDNDRNYVRLGWFENLHEAVSARKAAERKYGFHPNHGKAKPKMKMKTLRPEYAERDALVLRLRQTGMTYLEIGRAIGTDLSSARRIYLKNANPHTLIKRVQERK